MSQYYWIYGCIASVVGSVFSNLGVNIQKYSQMLNAKLNEADQVEHCHQPIWHLGFVLVVVGALADFGALSLAAQSIVAPIGSTTLVANIFFAYFWLGEELTYKDILGTVLVICGATLSVAFGDHSNATYTMDDIKSNFSNELFIGFIFVTLAFLIVCYALSRYLGPIRDDLLIAYVQYDEAKELKEKQRMKDCKITIALINQKYEPFQKIHPLSLCCIAGFVGGYSVLFAKIFSVLLKTSIGGDNQFTNGLTYLFLISMVVTIVGQINYLALALKYFDALYVVPVFQCFWITGSTFSGAFFFSEFDKFTPIQSVMFPIGVILTLIGVVILSMREMTRVMDEEDIALTKSTLERSKTIAESFRSQSNSKLSISLISGEFDHSKLELDMIKIDIDLPETDPETPSYDPVVPMSMKGAVKRQTMVYHAMNPHQFSPLFSPRAKMFSVKEELKPFETGAMSLSMGHGGLLGPMQEFFQDNIADKIPEKFNFLPRENIITRERAQTRMSELQRESSKIAKFVPSTQAIAECDETPNGNPERVEIDLGRFVADNYLPSN